MENIAGKNRPVATNFQFLKILAPLGQLLVGACLPQTLLGTSTANWNCYARSLKESESIWRWIF